MSYDELYKRPIQNEKDIVHKNRVELIKLLERTNTEVIIFPIYDVDLFNKPLDDFDPIHVYLKKNYKKRETIAGLEGKSLSNESFNLILFDRKNQN